MRRPPARDEGEMLGVPAGQGLSRRRGGDPAAGDEGTWKGPLAQRSPPLPLGPTVPSPPARGHDAPEPPIRGTSSEHLRAAPALRRRESRWNESNFSRPSQVGEIKQVTAGLFPGCEWTTLTSTSASSLRIYIILKE